MPPEASSWAFGVFLKPWGPTSCRYSALERIRRSGSGATERPLATSWLMKLGSPKAANSSSSDAPWNWLGSNAVLGNTFRQPMAIERNRSVLAGALPWIRPSWFPREMYHGTSRPAAVNGSCARSIRPA